MGHLGGHCFPAKRRSQRAIRDGEIARARGNDVSAPWPKVASPLQLNANLPRCRRINVQSMFHHSLVTAAREAGETSAREARLLPGDGQWGAVRTRLRDCSRTVAAIPPDAAALAATF
jgi:hypothetical protein